MISRIGQQGCCPHREGEQRERRLSARYTSFDYCFWWPGKLPLHPSKTNRDYLIDLQTEERIYPTFSSMTGAYEVTWYGERGATEDEFKWFRSSYKTIGS
jgi:hypothetical protein